MLKNKVLISLKNIDQKTIDFLTKNNVGVELDYFSFPENLEKEDLSDSIVNYKKLLKNFNHPVSLHGAFYDINITARDPKILEFCNFRILQSLEIAEKLCVSEVVFHANYFHSKRAGYKDYWIKKQVEFWKNIVTVAETKKIKIFLENTREENADYLNQIIDNVNSNFFKVCFDTGHSFCFTNSKVKPSEWVKSLSNRLEYIHLHSNYGIVDDHLAFSKGNLDFDDFFYEISNLKSNPYIVIEVKTWEDIEISLKELRKYVEF